MIKLNRSIRTLSMWATLMGIGLASALVTRAQVPSPTPSPAATPAASDIVIVDVKKRHDYKTNTDDVSFGEPKKITDFLGYNNQPFFLPDGKSILYTSIRNKQADIYRYDVESGKTTQVTDTLGRVNRTVVMIAVAEFFFILVCNWMEMIPSEWNEHYHFLPAPTADTNLTTLATRGASTLSAVPEICNAPRWCARWQLEQQSMRFEAS